MTDELVVQEEQLPAVPQIPDDLIGAGMEDFERADSVSYTHLTLPTILLV